MGLEKSFLIIKDTGKGKEVEIQPSTKGATRIVGTALSNAEERQQEWQDASQHNAIEGIFVEGNSKLGLGRIRARCRNQFNDHRSSVSGHESGAMTAVSPFAYLQIARIWS